MTTFDPIPTPGFSMGSKLLLVAVALLLFSFGLCAVGIVWLSAHFSPILAIEDYWKTTGHMIVILFVGTFALFSLAFFAVVDQLLNKPLRQFIEALDASPGRWRPDLLSLQRKDEWGVLGAKLNRYVTSLGNLHERSSVLYETARLLTTPPHVRDSLETVFTGLLHRYHLSSCLLFVARDRELFVEASAGLSTEFTQSLRVKLGEGLLGKVYATGVSRYMAHPSEHTDAFLNELLQRQPIGAAFLTPMKADDGVIGAAVYLAQPSRAFEDDQMEALSAFTDHVSLAFRNGRRMDELASSNQRLESELATTMRELHQTHARLVRKVRELKTVYDLALATAVSSNVNEVIDIMIRGVKEMAEVQAAGFFLLGNSRSLDPVGPVFNHSLERSAVLAASVNESPFLERIIQEEKAQLLNFVDVNEPLPAAWAPLGIRSILALPLRQGQEVKGLFCVINKINGLFSEDDTRVLSLLTSRVAEVLHRLTLDEQLHQQVHDLKVLQDIAAHLPSPPVLSDTVSVIGRIIRPALPGTDLCLFYLHHAASEALVPAGGDWDSSLAVDLRSLTLGASENVAAAQVFRSGEPAHVDKDAKELHAENLLWSIAPFEEVLYLPLMVEQGTIGTMVLARRKATSLSFGQRRLAGLIAKQVAIVIERSRLYERLHTANEKLEQINHLKNEFISMVSHELRTPLTTIKGFVSIVLNEETGPLNDQQRHFLETSDRAINRLTLLVSDLLDISRIEAGQIKMQLRPISMRDVIGRVATNFEPQFKTHALTLTLDVPEHLPPVLADPDRVTQVLDNLLSNALKYTSKGGVTISASDKGDFVMTSVRDTGSGIPASERDKIFEKFYQIKVGDSYPAKGTGLGLAIVRSIVESHRGKVWVEADSDHGAEFRFLMPRARPDADVTHSGASVL